MGNITRYKSICLNHEFLFCGQYWIYCRKDECRLQQVIIIWNTLSITILAWVPMENISLLLSFAAKSTTGMIYNVALLPQSNLYKLKGAYALYYDRYDSKSLIQRYSGRIPRRMAVKFPSFKLWGCLVTIGALGVLKLPWYLGSSICIYVYKF